MTRVYLSIIVSIAIEIILLFNTKMAYSMRLSMGTYFLILGGVLCVFMYTDKREKPNQNNLK